MSHIMVDTDTLNKLTNDYLCGQCGSPLTVVKYEFFKYFHRYVVFQVVVKNTTTNQHFKTYYYESLIDGCDDWGYTWSEYMNDPKKHGDVKMLHVSPKQTTLYTKD